ncbi:hypothetical protein AMTR_s00121p00085790 [Amborella trichopoda]|uniref:Uncharacterized protein n=1 Tax=Amborella trichopoda TaxID=13333 RepID=W1NSC7_AMBTC|nr:hypothetical protein AMTR_s00121p00085790 [Amborella trichopoda]
MQKMYPLPIHRAASKGRISSSRTRFVPMEVDLLAIMVVAEMQINAPELHQVEDDHVVGQNQTVFLDEFYIQDNYLAIVEAAKAQPLSFVHVPLDAPTVLPATSANQTRDLFDADEVELFKIGKMVDDMGMDCDVLIGVFFDELKARKKADGTANQSDVNSENGKSSIKEDVRTGKEMQSLGKKKESSNKIYFETDLLYSLLLWGLPRKWHLFEA